MRKTNKKGRPVGKPVLAGFEFEFSSPLNPASATNSANYQVDNVTTKRVKKKVERILHPITKFNVSYSNDAVTIVLAGHETFKTGGPDHESSIVWPAPRRRTGRNHGVHDLQGREAHHAVVTEHNCTASSDDIRGTIWTDNPGAGSYMTRFTPTGTRAMSRCFTGSRSLTREAGQSEIPQSMRSYTSRAWACP